MEVQKARVKDDPTKGERSGQQYNPLDCPSALCEEDAILLGIVGSDGRVGYVSPKLTVTAEFVQIALKGSAPEARFRFAKPCIESDCAHWIGSRCDFIERATSSSQEGVDANIPLPACVIRQSCRWFTQKGSQACSVCPEVIRNKPFRKPLQGDCS
jgi:hypothetical protein